MAPTPRAAPSAAAVVAIALLRAVTLGTGTAAGAADVVAVGSEAATSAAEAVARDADPTADAVPPEELGRPSTGERAVAAASATGALRGSQATVSPTGAFRSSRSPSVPTSEASLLATSTDVVLMADPATAGVDVLVVEPTEGLVEGGAATEAAEVADVGERDVLAVADVGERDGLKVADVGEQHVPLIAPTDALLTADSVTVAAAVSDDGERRLQSSGKAERFVFCVCTGKTRVELSCGGMHYSLVACNGLCPSSCRARGGTFHACDGMRQVHWFQRFHYNFTDCPDSPFMLMKK